MKNSKIPYKTSQKCRTLMEFTQPSELYRMREDTGKNATQRNQIKEILNDGMLHSPVEFQKAGILQYNARILELRKRGKIIESLRVGKDTFFRMKRS